MSRHDVATLLIAAAFYAAGIWTALMWHRTHSDPRHKETDHG